MIVNGVGLAVQAIVLSWVLKMEKSSCGCSERWQRDYIKWFAIANIVMAVLALAGLRFKNQILAGAAFGALLVNLYAILTYVPKMNTVGCKCATENDWRDNFIYWWTLVSVALSAFIALTLFAKM